MIWGEYYLLVLVTHFASNANKRSHGFCFRLGKTLQSLVAVAISHCSDMDECTATKRSLIVCPSTVVGHWVGEIHRFFPQSKVLSPFDFTGPAKERRKAWDKESYKHNIVVTSYSVLRSDIDILEKTIWDYCILDEGHLLKNPKTSEYKLDGFTYFELNALLIQLKPLLVTAKASRRLISHHRLILTGNICEIALFQEILEHHN